MKPAAIQRRLGSNSLIGGSEHFGGFKWKRTGKTLLCDCWSKDGVVKGRIVVAEDQISAEVDLPFALSYAKDVIEREISAALERAVS